MSNQDKDWPISCPMYRRHLALVRDFKQKKGFKTLAESIGVIVEYANAHGALE